MAENETPIDDQQGTKIEVETDASAAQDEVEVEGTESVNEDVPVVDVDALQKELSAAQEKINELTDTAVRAQAEMQNVRRRAERDVENAHKFGLEKFVNDLLPVVDSLERGLDTLSEDEETLKPAREGMALTLKMLLDAAKKYGVEQVDPVGEPFDPNLHEAMTMVESPDAEPNSVLNVLQRGYTLNGRLVRPAMVVIAKAAS